MIGTIDGVAGGGDPATAIGAEDHIMRERGDEGFQVAAPVGGGEGADDSIVLFSLHLAGRGFLHACSRGRCELTTGGRRATHDLGDLSERNVEDVM